MAMRERKERGRKLPQVKPNQKNSVGKGRKKGKENEEMKENEEKQKNEEESCAEERRKKKEKKKNDTFLRDLRLTGG